MIPGAAVRRHPEPEMIEWGRIGASSGGSPLAPFGGGFLTPQEPHLAFDQIRNDIWAMPYRGPLDLDSDGSETSQSREKYRDLYRREGIVRAAIDGKVDAIASAEISVEPADRHDPRSRDVAEFLRWSVEQSEDGWDGVIATILRPSLIDGWSAAEPTLRPRLHPKFGESWPLWHLRSLDTRFLRLRLDVFRNVEGVVSLVRGLETFSPEKVILFTHRKIYSNPFGTSDLRAAFRDANLLEDAYKLWYLALRMYGEPYIHGLYSKAERQGQMMKLLEQLRAGGYAATPKEDDIKILSLAAAVNFQAFESVVKNHRENIFLAIRGAYLPFVEGTGGNEAHGNAEVGKVSTDTGEYLLSVQIARVINQQLVPKLIHPQFGPNTPLPKVKLGGVNWDDIKKVADTYKLLKETFPGRLSLSATEAAEKFGLSPATDPDDELNVAPPTGGPDQPGGGGGGGGPGGGGATPPPGGIAGGGAVVPPGSAADGPAALPTSPAASPTTGFSAADAAQYASHFEADQHGRYPGTMHEDYGLPPAAFIRATGLKRKQVGRENPRWWWVRPAEVVPDKTFSDGSPPGPPPRPGLQWKAETHRWVNPHAGDEHPREPATSGEVKAGAEQPAAEFHYERVGDAISSAASKAKAISNRESRGDIDGDEAARLFSAWTRSVMSDVHDRYQIDLDRAAEQFASDFGPGAIVSPEWRAVRDAVKAAYQTVKSHVVGAAKAARYRTADFHPTVAAAREAAAAGQVAIGDAIRAARDAHGGKKETHPLKRYFFSAEVEESKGTPGAAELAVAMMEAYADGDDDTLDALRDLADDPDGLAELIADVEGGHYGTPGRAAFAATVRTFAAGTKCFGWVADPTPRSKTRATNTESGTHAYGKRAATLLAAQGRADRGEPEPETPQAKAQRFKQEREPARADARAAWQKATTDPASLTPGELGALADHLHTLTRDEVREQVKQIRGGGHGGKLKAELVDALHQHARELVEYERGKEGVLADAMRQHLDANPGATDAEVLGRFGRGRPEVARRVLEGVRKTAAPPAATVPRDIGTPVEPSESPDRTHTVALPKDKRRLTIDQAQTALEEMGYRREWPPIQKKVGNALVDLHRLTNPDGTESLVTADEIRQLVYDGAVNPPGLGKPKGAATSLPTLTLTPATADTHESIDGVLYPKRADAEAVPRAVASSPPAPAAKPKRAPKPPAWIASDPVHAAVAEAYRGATGRAREVIENALDNAGWLAQDKNGNVAGWNKAEPEDANAGQRPIDMAAGALASGHRHLLENGGTPEELAHVERALEAAGAERIDDASGGFDGALHENYPGAFTGHPVRVVHPGWKTPNGSGQQVPIQAKVEPAGGERTFASGPPRPGLVAQTGDNDHPGRWVRPEKAGGGGESGGGGSTPSEPSPGTDSGPPPDQTRAAATAAIQAADPKADAGLVSRLADQAVTAAAKAHIALSRLTPAMLKAIDVVTAVADTPADMVGKFGFNPTFTSGGVGPRVADPVQDATGMSAHLAATLVGKVVGDGLVWVKNKTGVKLYAEEPDAVAGAAAVLHEAFAAVAEEFGLSEPPSAEEIAEHMRAAGD